MLYLLLIYHGILKQYIHLLLWSTHQSHLFLCGPTNFRHIILAFFQQQKITLNFILTYIVFEHTMDISRAYIMPLFFYFQLKYIHKYRETHTYTPMCICIFAQNIRPVLSGFFSSVLCVTSRAPYSCRGLYSCDSVSVGTHIHIHTFIHARILSFSTHANRCCAYISLYTLRPLKIV